MLGLKRQELFYKILCLFVIGCIFAYLLVFAVMNIWGFDNFCNSDVYADTQVARKMWEQKTLFPEGWRFGNQYYVVATPVLTALFYGRTETINISMALATEFMTLLILASFVWLMRAFTKDTLLQLTAVLLLISSAIAPYGPYSVNSMLFYMQASFYSCYLITMFVVFGDYIRLFSGKKPSLLPWVLAMLLCFATGMQSLRQTVVTILPIVACEMLFTIRRLCLHEKIWSRTIAKRFARVAGYAVANFAGVLVIGQMDISSATIYGQMQMIPPDEWKERILPIKTAVVEIMSLDYIATGDYLPGLAVVILFMIAIVLIATVMWILRIKHQEKGEYLCWLLCVVGMVGVFSSTVVLNITLRAIYVFMWFPLVAVSGMMVLKKLPEVIRKCAVLSVCLLSMISLFYCYFPYVQILTSGEETAEYQLAQWAVDNEYEYVYGEYWSVAPAIAVCTDGKVNAGCWHSPENVFQVEMSNTPQDIYGAEENAKAIYVFQPADEIIGLQKAREQGVSMTKVAEFGDLRVYTSPVPLMYVI